MVEPLDDESAEVGKHLIIDLHDAQRLDEMDHVRAALRQSAEALEATVLGEHEHEFPEGGGCSAYLLLEESHISIHTWAEQGYAAVDIFVYGEVDPSPVLPVIQKAFEPGRVEMKEHSRGGLLESDRYMRRLYKELFIGEIWGKGNQDAVNVALHPEFRDSRPIESFPGNREGHGRMAADWREIFPDMQFTVQSMIVEGNVLVGRYSAVGTQQRGYEGFPATDAMVKFTGTDWCTFAEGQIIKWDHEEDNLGLIEQIAEAANEAEAEYANEAEAEAG